MSSAMGKLKVALLTREWPPQIYGGAGVHVSNLASALGSDSNLEVDIHCFGGLRSDATGYSLSAPLTSINPALQALLIDSDMALNCAGAMVVHSHTWYANFAGHLASKMHGIPHVITAHSLEPLRPWKADQLGGGYQISSWVEAISYEGAAAIIAVSDGMRSDILANYPKVDPKKVVTIRNGIDLARFQNRAGIESTKQVLARHGVTEPFALFVGRITRQKGLAHLLRAWSAVPKEFALVLAASSPDEPAIATEVENLIAELQRERPNVFWIKEMLPHDDLVALLSSARVFICPSVYEPLGIVNLEAMACETAVIASAVGGIPEVVVDGQTGLLVSFESGASKFEADLAESIQKVMSDETLAQQLGRSGRIRAEREFTWDKVARQTIELYRSLI